VGVRLGAAGERGIQRMRSECGQRDDREQRPPCAVPGSV